MEVEAEDKEVVEISVDSVLGELQSVLKGKFTESDSSSDSDEEEEPIKNGLSREDALQEHSNKTDEEKIVENSSGSPVSPSSYVERPIFFKSSIKKDPGSKMHDQLVKELGSVLKKRSQQNGDLDPVKEEETKVKNNSNNKKPGPLKANSVFANKALLAHLENHLQKSLHKTTVAGKSRSSVNDSSFDNKPNDLPDIMESSISGAAQFGVKLRPTQKRAQKSENIITSAGISSTSSLQLHQESSQSDILLQAKASLSGTKVQQPSKSLTVKTDKNTIVPTVSSFREKNVTTNNSTKPPSVELLKFHDNKVSKNTSVKTDDNVFHVSTLKKEGRHLTQINISGAVSMYYLLGITAVLFIFSLLSLTFNQRYLFPLLGYS